jgi:methyl-accepting chemotaxis protein
MPIPATGTAFAFLTQVLRPAPNGGASLRDFFRHHGVWSPGVRLLRRWSFRSKLLLLLALLGLPLLWLLGSLALAEHEGLQAQDQRLRGAELALATYTLAGPLHQELAAHIKGASPAAVDIEQPLRALEAAVAQALAAGIDIEQDWEAQATVVRQLAGPAQATDAATRRDALSRALAALVTLHRRGVDASGLLVHPDKISKVRASTTYNHLPGLQSDLSRMTRPLQLLAVRLAAGEAPSEAQLRPLVVTVAAHAEAVERSLARIDENARAAGDRAGTETTGLLSTRELMQRVDAWLAEPARLAEAGELARLASRSMNHIQETRLALSTGLVAAMQRDLVEARDRLIRTCGVILLMLLLAAYCASCTFLVMRGGLRALERSMARMAEGDLSSPLAAHGGDEIAVTLTSLRQATNGLSDLLASVREGVAAFRQASTTVAEGNGELSSRSRTMASHLDTLVEGIGVYSAHLQACGRQVESVVLSVQKLRLEAARNRKHVAHLEERMQALLGKTREIGQIVTLIDGIAFRTNILALNASVEASKAGGDLGRGFAVVAQEVRSLARRAAGSAQRIGDIVARSTEDFEFASALVTETGRSLASADVHVNEIHGAMTQVSALTQAGTRQAGEVVEGLGALKDSTDKNLQLVHQLATASSALRSQGERLLHRIGHFKLS